MKQLIIALFLVSSFAFADANHHGAEVVLKAGTSIVVQADTPTRVSCEGGDESAPRCRVARGDGCSSNYPMAIVDENGENILGRCYSDVETALELLVKLQRVGQCR